ncbi:MAG: hypothetical protein HC913_09965 [Microscillaceae bacterium]|nr:hypothetical protein [Microscillaceae bacterium]
MAKNIIFLIKKLKYLFLRFKMKSRLFIYFAISALFSCSHEEVETKLVEAEAVKIASKSDLGKNIYFQGIDDIEKIDGSFYLLDSDINKIFCTDEDLNYKFSFMESGGAEYEATGSVRIACFNEVIYVADVSAGKIMLFDKNGKFLKNHRSDHWGIGDFFVFDAGIATFNDNENYKEKPFMIWNEVKGTKSFFGKKADKRLKNADRHLIRLSKGKMMSVYAENRPIIEIYSDEGEQLSEKDLGDLALFNPVLRYYEKDIEKNPSTALVLIPDIYYTSGKLYLLITYMNSKEEWFSDVVIECEVNIDRNKIQATKIIKLDKKQWYESLFIDAESETLFVGGEAIIEKYSLP